MERQLYEFLAELRKGEEEPIIKLVKTETDNEFRARRAIIDKFHDESYSIRRLVRINFTVPSAN